MPNGSGIFAPDLPPTLGQSAGPHLRAPDPFPPRGSGARPRLGAPRGADCSLPSAQQVATVRHMATDDNPPMNAADALNVAAQQMINGYPDLAQAVMDRYGLGLILVREKIREVYGTRGALWLANNRDPHAALVNQLAPDPRVGDRMIREAMAAMGKVVKACDIIEPLLNAHPSAADYEAGRAFVEENRT